MTTDEVLGVMELRQEIRRLRADLAEVVDCLRWVHDLHNGCPLPKYEKDWNREMARAKVLLERYEPPL